MDRTSLVTKAFQHRSLLAMDQSEYRKWVLSFLTALLEDDQKKGDLTIKTLFPNNHTIMTAMISAKNDGILAGIEELAAFYATQEIRFEPCLKDGSIITRGTTIAKITGPAKRLLELERLGLDLLGRMSGIATYTHRLINLARNKSSVAIAATRKTLWGVLDKKAVGVGGGLTHRLGVWQAILIKDNHLAGLKNIGFLKNFQEAVFLSKEAAESQKAAFLEVEVESPEEAFEVAKIFSNINIDVPVAILLDNFSAEVIRKTIKKVTEESMRSRIILEASGGITENNLEEFATTGVDVLSMGCLTHSVRTFDFSQKIIQDADMKCKQ